MSCCDLLGREAFTWLSLGNNPQQRCIKKKASIWNVIMNNPISTAESKEEEKGKMENVRLKINQVILA